MWRLLKKLHLFYRKRGWPEYISGSKNIFSQQQKSPPKWKIGVMKNGVCRQALMQLTVVLVLVFTNSKKLDSFLCRQLLYYHMTLFLYDLGRENFFLFQLTKKSGIKILLVIFFSGNFSATSTLVWKLPYPTLITIGLP